MSSEEGARAEIVALYTQLLEAWNRRDAAAFAALFADDGMCIGFDGSQMDGRAQIGAELSSIFASYPTAPFVAKVRVVRRIDEQVALLRAIAGMVPPGQSELNPALNAVQVVAALKQGDQWKITLLQNTPAAFHGRPHLVKQQTDELAEVVRAGRIVQTA